MSLERQSDKPSPLFPLLPSEDSLEKGDRIEGERRLTAAVDRRTPRPAGQGTREGAYVPLGASLRAAARGSSRAFVVETAEASRRIAVEASMIVILYRPRAR